MQQNITATPGPPIESKLWIDFMRLPAPVRERIMYEIRGACIVQAAEYAENSKAS